MKSKKQPKGASTESRRRFTKAAVAALVAAPVGATLAQTTPAPREPKAPPNPQPSPTPAPQQQPPQTTPAGAAYAEVARARFGEYLKPEEFERVKRDLEGNVRSADRLRAHKLKNSDEPDFVFSA